MDKTTEIIFSEKDVGKNLYRKITYYTLGFTFSVLSLTAIMLGCLHVWSI